MPAKSSHAARGVGFRSGSAGVEAKSGLSLPPQADNKTAIAQLAYNEALHFPFISSPVVVGQGASKWSAMVATDLRNAGSGPERSLAESGRSFEDSNAPCHVCHSEVL
jgi:hypothetical protein